MTRLLKVYAYHKMREDVELIGTVEVNPSLLVHQREFHSIPRLDPYGNAVKSNIHKILETPPRSVWGAQALNIALCRLGIRVTTPFAYPYSAIKLMPDPGLVRVYRNNRELCTCSIDHMEVANAIYVTPEDARVLLEELRLVTSNVVYTVEYDFA